MSVRRSQFAIRLYVAACVLVAIVFVAVAIHTFPLDREAAIGFGLLSFIVAQFPLTLPTGALYDITFLITIAAIIAGGPGDDRGDRDQEGDVVQRARRQRQRELRDDEAQQAEADRGFAIERERMDCDGDEDDGD